VFFCGTIDKTLIDYLAPASLVKYCDIKSEKVDIVFWGFIGEGEMTQL